MSGGTGHPASITSISASSGPCGTAFTISGSQFTASTTFYFVLTTTPNTSYTLSATFVNSGSVTCTVPSGTPAATYYVTLANNATSGPEFQVTG